MFRVHHGVAVFFPARHYKSSDMSNVSTTTQCLKFRFEFYDLGFRFHVYSLGFQLKFVTVV